MKSHVRFVNLLAVVFATAVGTTGCSDSSLESVVPDPELVEICLNGNVSLTLTSEGTPVQAMLPESRAIINTKHDVLSLSFARLDMDIDGNYPSTGYASVSAVLSATLAKSDDGSASAITFNPKEYYIAGRDDTKNKTKLVGWHPAVSADVSNTVSYASGVVTLPINGENDIMLSGEAEGNKTTPFGSVTFSHKLTQIKMLAYAVSPAAQSRWGKIKNIVLKDQVPTCKITLPSTVAWDGAPADLALVKKKAATDEALDAELELGVADVDDTGKITEKNATECGYAMFKPIAAGTKLSLEIEMTDGRKESLTIDWADGYLEGKAYTITLKFTVAEIEFDAQITDWEEFEWPTGDDDFKGEIEL